MKRKLITTALISGALVGAAVAQSWNGLGVATDWSDINNWDTGTVPNGTAHIIINSAATPSDPTLDVFIDVSAVPVDPNIGFGGGSGTLNIDAGGTLDAGGKWIRLGEGGGTGTMNVLPGGALDSTAHVRLMSPTSEFNILGGTVNAGGVSGGGTFAITAGSAVTSTGNFEVDDGTAGTLFDGSIAAGGEIFVGNGGGSGTSTLDILGGTVESNNWIAVGRDGATGILNIAGGTVDVATGATDHHVAIGTNGGNGTVNQTGGVFNPRAIWLGENGASVGTYAMSGGSISAAVLSVAPNGNTVGTFTMTGGTVTLDNSVVTYTRANGNNGTSNGLNLNAQETGTATVNLNGGTLNTVDIIAGANGGTGSSNISLGGTDINLLGDAAGSFFAGAGLTVSLNAVTTNINTGGFNGSGDGFFTGTGGITKQGGGILGLVGSDHDFSGDIDILEGGVALGGASSFGFSGDITMSDGTSFEVITNSLDDLIEPNDFSVGSTTSTLTFDFVDSDFAIPFAPVEVLGTLSLSGTITVNLQGANFTSGTYTLIDYSGGSKSGSATWVIGSLPAGVNAVGGIIDTGSEIQLQVSAGAVTWTGGASGDWDLATINWEDDATMATTNFTNGANVTFADSADFATTVNTFNVTVTENVSPASVLFTHEFETYTLVSGGGVIEGSTDFVTEGAGDLNINGMTNLFTGPAILGGSGTVTIDSFPAGGVAGPLGNQANTADTLVLAGANLNIASPANVNVDRNFTLAAGTGSTITNDGDMNFDTLPLQGTGGITFNGAGDVNYTYAATDHGFGGGNPALAMNDGTLTFNTPALVTIGGELQIGTNFGETAHLDVIDTTLNVTSWLAVNRGTGTGVVSNIDITNSTVTAGNMSVGWDNGLGGPNDSVANITIDNSSLDVGGQTILAESFAATANISILNGSSFEANLQRLATGAGANALITVSDTSTLAAADGDFRVGGGANSTATVVLNDSSMMSHDGGGWMLIGDGREGAGSTGTVTLNGNSSLANNAQDLVVGYQNNAQGILNINDNASVTHAPNGWAVIGREDTSTGTINVNGAGSSFTSPERVVLGDTAAATGIVNVNAGTFAITGNDGNDLFEIGHGGIGVLNVDGGLVQVVGTASVLVGGDGGSNGTINLNSGTLNPNSVLIGAGAGVLNIDGGTLLAVGSVAPFLSVPTDVGAGGGTIDNNGANIGITSTITGAGTLTCVGAGGTTTFSGATGAIGCDELLVSSGTVALDTSDALLANTLTVNVTTGSSLALNYVGIDTITAFEVDGVDAGTGIFNSTTHPGILTGTGQINVTGGATPYDTWAAGYWSTTDLGNPSISGPDGDGNNNGTPNKVYFAHGGDPTSPTGAPQIFFLEEDSDADGDTTTEFLLTIAVRAGTPAFAGSPSPSATHEGFTVTVQGSNDIEDRTAPVSVAPTPVTTGLGAAPAGYEWRTFSLDGSNGLTGSGYMNTTVK